MRYAHTIDDKMVEKTIDVMKRREERAKEAQKIARRRMMEERMRAVKAIEALKAKLNAAKASL